MEDTLRPEMIGACLAGWLMDALEKLGRPTNLDPRPIYDVQSGWTPEERREAYLWATGVMGYDAANKLPNGSYRRLAPDEQPHPMPPCVMPLLP